LTEKSERKRLEILRILRDANGSVGSSMITERLLAAGYEISERTVRFYLHEMDGEQLTRNLGRKGHTITPRGMQELANARIIEKVGFLAVKIDQLTYQMNFDLASNKGTVVVNVSMVEKSQVDGAIPLIKRVFQAGYGMGRLVALFKPGERIGETLVPDGTVGIGTVCSITLNGVLLAHGIPTYSRFGGLLELQNYKPTRFVEVIHYDGTTLDPLEVFIRSGMTDYTGATETGTGRIGASFRELPAESREQVTMLARQLDLVGLGGFMSIGWPGQPLLEIPVQQGRIGAVVMGGLNPAGILEESGIATHSRALASLAEYEIFFPYEEMDSRVQDMI
jgi:repressor of nif and glnA expression